MKATFFKTVIPSILAFAFLGVYELVDGFFIGQKMGDSGLASINIAYPIAMLIQAIGTGIGMGGAIRFSINRGSGNEAFAKKYIENTISLLGVLGIIATLVLFFSYHNILILFGASGELLYMSSSYIQVIILGAIFQILSAGLVPILRNLGKPTSAMLFMVCGFFSNIILDYLFIIVFPFGMMGASMATVAGQIITCILCILSVSRTNCLSPFRSYRLNINVIKEIITVGLSPFGLTISPNLVLIIMNRFIIDYGGTQSISAYSVTSYIISIVQLLFQGIGDGSQPLISIYLGNNNQKAASFILKMSYITAGCVATLSTTLIIIARAQIPQIFGASQGVSNIVGFILPILSIGLPISAFIRITISYFYSIEENILSYALVYGEPTLLFIILMIMTKVCGLEGIWIANPLTQFILGIFGLTLLILRKKRPMKFKS